MLNVPAAASEMELCLSLSDLCFQSPVLWLWIFRTFDKGYLFLTIAVDSYSVEVFIQLICPPPPFPMEYALDLAI